jgi:hypothetical protein
MYKWLIIALLLIAFSILPPVVIWWLSQRSRLSSFLRSFHGVQSQFMGLMAVLFSLNLVFVCNEIWQSRDAATFAMSREAEALRNIGRIASNIPERGGIPIFDAARQYLGTTIEFDFPNTSVAANASLAASPKSSLPAIIKLSDAVLDTRTLETLDPAIRTLLIAQLTIIRDKRLDRIAFLERKPNKVKWLSLIFLEVMSLLSIAIVHIANGRALLVACFIYLSGVNPFLVILYSSQWPFSGLDPLNDTVLAAALDRLTGMEAEYKKK